jgi:subtilisin family serine protease
MATPSWRERYLRWLEWFRSARRRKADERKLPSKGVPRHKTFANIDYSHLELVEDTEWDDAGGSFDPSLRLAVSLIETQDQIQLFERTGIDTAIELDDSAPPEKQQQYLSMHLELNEPLTAEIKDYLATHGLLVPDAYFDEAENNDQLRSLTARISLGKEIVTGDAKALRDRLLALGKNSDRPGLIKRMSLGTMIQPSFWGASFGDIDMPAQRQVNAITVDGSGIVVGIVDDGCAFPHLDFLKPGTTQSRVVYLWDQTPGAETRGGNWVQPSNFNYGAELSNNPADPVQALDAAIAAHLHPDGTVDEDAVYEAISYDAMMATLPSRVTHVLGALASHGTHVMGIAAGNGQSAMGFEGIAPKADIIFVQLPPADIQVGMSALTPRIQDAVLYIFRRAHKLGKQAVVNVSYGGYAGPHDGTAPIEIAMDKYLRKHRRAVVVSAGNGFEANCHARFDVDPGTFKTRHWMIHPFDPTLNFMQIWYNGDAKLEFRITTPDGLTLGPVLLGQHMDLVLPSANGPGLVVGWVDHQIDTQNRDKHIDITLRPTYDDPLFPLTAPPPPNDLAALAIAGDSVAPAPSGVWVIELRNNAGDPEAYVHAWIERDDSGRPGGARRRQSQFVTDEVDPKRTIGALATGHHTIAVGAYNTATHEVCRYSACGPTRPIGSNQNNSRTKPEVCAPAEDDAAGRGILSASSRKSRATRMNGTSASAPFVTGLVALLMQYRESTGGSLLSADQIRAKLTQGATQATLRPNRHNAVDATQIIKQGDPNVFNDVIGAGKINVGNTF